MSLFRVGLIAGMVCCLMASAVMGATVGITSVGDHSTVNTSITLKAQKITMPENGQIISIKMYHEAGTSGKKMILGMYNNASNAPGGLIASTMPTDIQTTTGWQDIPLTAPFSLPANTVVWLAWIYETSPKLHYVDETGSSSVSSELAWSGSLPNPSEQVQESLEHTLFMLFIHPKTAHHLPEIIGC